MVRGHHIPPLSLCETSTRSDDSAHYVVMHIQNETIDDGRAQYLRKIELTNNLTKETVILFTVYPLQ